MAYAPIALTMPQYDKDVYASWWLKAYQQGTTTPLSMATDATGGTLLVKAQLDTTGYPLTAGAVRFTPFIDGDYDLWLFPTEVEANTNDTTNAVQFADNVNADPESGIPYATLVTLTGAETLTNKTLTAPIANSPVLNGTLSGTGFLDEDDMVSDSAIAVASQQSIKAYVDTYKIVTGTLTFNSVLSNANVETTITHGLGTDDVDFGLKAVGSGGLAAEKSAVRCAIFDINRKFVAFREYTSAVHTGTEAEPTTPLTGTLAVTALNLGPSTQNITIDWWVRIR